MKDEWQHSGSTEDVEPTTERDVSPTAPSTDAQNGVALGDSESVGQPPSAGEWFTVTQTAVALTLSEKVVRERISKGQIPAASKVVLESNDGEWRIPAAWVRWQQMETEQKDAAGHSALSTHSSFASVRREIRQRKREESASLPIRKRSDPDPSLVKREAEQKKREVKSEALYAALLAEKTARIHDLQMQVDSLRAQLSAEQVATSEMRWLLSQAVRALPDPRDKEESEPSSTEKTVPPRRSWWTLWWRPKRET
jgi:hypothetical protein